MNTAIVTVKVKDAVFHLNRTITDDTSNSCSGWTAHSVSISCIDPDIYQSNHNNFC